MPSELEQESAGAAGLPRCGLLCTRARRMLVGAQFGAVQLLCSPTAASARARTYLAVDSMVRAAAGTWRGQEKSVCGRAVWSFPFLELRTKLSLGKDQAKREVPRGPRKSQVASLGYPSTHRSPKRRPHAHYDTQRAMPRPDRVAITPDIRGESVPV